ncbi:hypothetical protein WAI453_003750 [Rhynchosporium graminicola]|uniref:Related to ribosomal protein YmS18, mitochondrial n=1 Tax=Rhynchosporium graminicola TaxID=2792576 RepID=A0A1E1JZ19_9HELO|nr:related to ribosomal protein YmS18, mitochondrial [Rhynchosporium commune]
MSRIASRRLLAKSPLSSLSSSSCLPTTLSLRQISSTTSLLAEDSNQRPKTPSGRAYPTLPGGSNFRKGVAVARPPVSPSLHPQARTSDLSGLLGDLLEQNKSQRQQGRYNRYGSPPDFAADGSGNLLAKDGEHVDATWQLHIYAHRHNVHITLVRPPSWIHPQTGRRYPEKGDNRTIALSLAAGNLGFRHAGRKHYDSAFQLASYVMARMQESGISSWIGSLEVFMRGFGAGREAVTKALLGLEGKALRGKIVKVTDSTRVKFGGSRSKKPRRLG